MKKYIRTDISEQQLEDLVRQDAGSIEKDLVYIDHHRAAAGGRLDVLMRGKRIDRARLVDQRTALSRKIGYAADSRWH